MNAVDELISAMYAWCRQIEIPRMDIVSERGQDPCLATYRIKDLSDIKAVYVSRSFFAELRKSSAFYMSHDVRKILGVPVFVVDDSINEPDQKHQDYFIAGKIGAN